MQRARKQFDFDGHNDGVLPIVAALARRPSDTEQVWHRASHCVVGGE